MRIEPQNKQDTKKKYKGFRTAKYRRGMNREIRKKNADTKKEKAIKHADSCCAVDRAEVKIRYWDDCANCVPALRAAPIWA